MTNVLPEIFARSLSLVWSSRYGPVFPWSNQSPFKVIEHRHEQNSFVQIVVDLFVKLPDLSGSLEESPTM